MESGTSAILLVLVAGLSFVAGAVVLKAYQRMRMQPPGSGGRTQLLAAQSGLKVDTVMLGDSLTEVIPWPVVMGDPYIANFGVGGDTTEVVLHRLDAVIAVRPRRVVLMAGTNDALRDVPAKTAVENIQSIVARLSASGISTEVFAIPPLGHAKAEERRREINSMLREALPSLHDSGIALTHLRTDGIHPKLEGSLAFIAKVREVIGTAQAAKRSEYSS